MDPCCRDVPHRASKITPWRFRHLDADDDFLRGSFIWKPARLLAAVATCLGQDGVDLVGPDASQGPDGIQDLDLQLSGLSGTAGEIIVQAPGGFEWATEPDPAGAALAEYFPSATAGQGDLYINPQVKSDLGTSGQPLPLGGSTGSLIQLANGMTLTITINYQNQATPDVTTVAGIQPRFGDRSHAGGRDSRQRGGHVSGHRRRAGRNRTVLRTGLRPSRRDRPERS